MTDEFRKGDRVEWRSHGGTAEGIVEQKLTTRTEAAGRTVDASSDEPQYLVRSERAGALPFTSPRRCVVVNDDVVDDLGVIGAR